MPFVSNEPLSVVSPNISSAVDRNFELEREDPKTALDVADTNSPTIKGPRVERPPSPLKSPSIAIESPTRRLPDIEARPCEQKSPPNLELDWIETESPRSSPLIDRSADIRTEFPTDNSPEIYDEFISLKSE
jgi:hypothetical protein